MKYKELFNGPCIYMIKNIVNGKIYIGKSIHVKTRFSLHRNALRKNQHYNLYLQAAWNKYGEDNFLFLILEKCASIYLSQKEVYWINKFFSLDKNFGYNIEPPNPNGGNFVSLETRRKISEKQMNNKYSCGSIRSQEYKDALSKARKGIPKSQEIKDKISKSKIGKPGSQSQKDKVSKEFHLLSPDNKEFHGRNIRQFCKKHGLTPSNIHLVISGIRKHHKGWRVINVNTSN